MILYSLFALLIVLIDQFVKYWVVTHLALEVSYPFIPGLLNLYYLRNDGAAWGILSGRQLFFILLTIGVVIFLSRAIYHDHNRHPFVTIGYTFLLGGAIGNFIDRLLYGSVVDMFQTTFINFPIFNVADASITIGVIIVLIDLFFMKEGGEE